MSENNYQQHVVTKLKKDYYMQTNHISLVSVKPDYAKLSMEVTDVSLNGFGCVHGGVLFGLADTAAGAAAFTDGRHYVTQSGNFHFIGNVASGVVFAEGNVVHRGKTITVVEVKVFSEEGKLLGNGTYGMFSVNKPFWNIQKNQETTDQSD